MRIARLGGIEGNLAVERTVAPGAQVGAGSARSGGCTLGRTGKRHVEMDVLASSSHSDPMNCQ